MKHSVRIGVAVLIYVVIIWVMRPGSHQEKAVGPDGQPAPEVGPVVWKPPQPITFEDRLHWKQTEERVQQLAAQEQDLARRERAIKEMPVSRRQLQLGAMGAWAEIIQTNMPLFHELYQKAKEDPHGETVCTICDGYSYMRCVMCNHHDGKCRTCNGTRRNALGEFCPSCVGTGRCYLCSGRGKMFCPFCDDGMVKLRMPLPHYTPPGG